MVPKADEEGYVKCCATIASSGKLVDGRYFKKDGSLLGYFVGSRKEKAARCPQGHVLKDVGFKSNGWACDGRNRLGGCKSGCTGFYQMQAKRCYCCGQCDYDLCEDCYMVVVDDKEQ